MKKLLMLAFAAMVFAAIPASASAKSADGSVFKHNNNVVTATTQVTVGGTAGFTSGGNTVHCPEIHATVDLLANGTGQVTHFTCTNGKLNGVLDVDATAVSPHSWIVESKKTDTIIIRNLTIHNVFTSGGTPVGTSTLAGEVRATLLGNPLNTNTAELSSVAGALTSNGAAASAFGHVNFGGTTIGVE